MEALTSIIAVLALWIAYQQWKMNSLRYRHELYERRLNVYKVLVKLLHEAHNATTETVASTQDILLESHFLFKKETPEFIENIWNKTNELAKLNSILNEGHSDLTMKKNWSRLIDEINTMEKQTRSLFSPYLNLMK